MIDNFLIINCTGTNNLIGIKTHNKFFIEKLQNNLNSNNLLVSNIINFTSKYKVKLSGNYSILVNLGPGSYSTLRISLSVAKGIQIVLGSKL
jgi:tRNA A37 threonylcarbamoyladenosine modification protein TsaB